MVRVTFALDEATVQRIRRTAARLGKPQSHVVREAVADFAARADRMSEAERLRVLTAIGAIRSRKSSRTGRAVDAELEAIRRARRTGGRGSG
jgi:predicted transcriptional regulator